MEALLSFCKDFKPDIRVHLGDNWDFRNLRKGASDDERAHSLEDDWVAGLDFFNSFFDAKSENHFLRGNHDERLWGFARSASGLLRDYAHDGIKRVEQACARRKAKMLPYDSANGILKLGHLSILHGYAHGMSACRIHAATYGNCLFGHVHTQESAPVPSLEPAEARSNACLCIRDMDYANAKIGKLRWAQGWSYGHIFNDGSYQLFQTRKINNQFHVATEIKGY